MGTALLSALACLIVWGRNRRTLISLRDAYGFSLIALLPALFSPFPILGTWDGDWFFLYQAGQTVWEGGRLSPESLQRPPLFGAAAAPLWIFAEGLIPFQIFSAVMSAGVLAASFFALHHFVPRTSRLRVIALLVMAPFFLHHTAACWGKLMAAGLLVAAGTELRRSRDSRTLLWSGVWFALAVAAHQSSLLYAPLLIAIRVSVHGWKASEIIRLVFAMGLAGLLLVAPYEVWTIYDYGLDQKVAVNPAVAQRDPEIPMVLNTLLVVVSSFVGWAPLESLFRWWWQPDALALARVASEAFWMITSWIQTLAGTFLGTYAPLFIAGGVTLLNRLRVAVSTQQIGFLALASGAVILLNGLLNPFYSSNGTMQTGLTALGLAGFLVLSHLLLTETPRRWAVAMAVTALCGTFPWLLLNLGTSLGLRLSPAFRSRVVGGSERDWDRLSDHQLIPLGLSGFPALQLGLVLILLIGFIFRSALFTSFQVRDHA